MMEWRGASENVNGCKNFVCECIVCMKGKTYNVCKKEWHQATKLLKLCACVRVDLVASVCTPSQQKNQQPLTIGSRKTSVLYRTPFHLPFCLCTDQNSGEVRSGLKWLKVHKRENIFGSDF
jgi:hypothetical protein